MAPANGVQKSQPFKRTRASASRVKTGCLTCKARRVKCDEAKPHCRRCQRFGVACDGYMTYTRLEVSGSEASIESSATNSAITPKRSPGRSPPLFAASPSTSVCEDESENRYFTLFQEKTAADIMPYFKAENWRRLVLQACNVPAIRHAVIALGALDKTSMISWNGKSMCVDLTGKNGNPKLHHAVAVEHYSKAIRCMRTDVASGDQTLRTALISCLIIACFEAFHGNFRLANAQICTGIALIDDWKASLSFNQNAYGHMLPSPNMVDDELVQAFGRLEIQTIGATEKRGTDLQLEIYVQGGEQVAKMPKIFESLEEARIYLEILIRRMEYIGNAAIDIQGEDTAAKAWKEESLEPHTTSPRAQVYTSIADIERDRDRQLNDVAEWEKALEALMNQSDMPESAGSLLLRLHARTNYISLRAITGDSDVYDELTNEFWSIVTLSRSILEGFKDAGAPKFTLDMGVILPLNLAGLRCRVSSVRRQVVDLLLAYPRREGTWDSFVAGRIVDWVQQVEEEFMVGGRVPAWARVSAMSNAFDAQEGKATVVCTQRISADTEETRERKTVITW